MRFALKVKAVFFLDCIFYFRVYLERRAKGFAQNEESCRPTKR